VCFCLRGDVEYVGNPGLGYRNTFSGFIRKLSGSMHEAIKDSRVTVSVYASSVKSPKLYNIAEIGKYADGIFMMAYDFAVTGSEVAMPTAPLYGYKEGKYSYDISTAVEDFVRVMPAEKLILGVPYYGYNYSIYGEPKIKADTRPSWSWRGSPMVQTYAIANTDITPEREGWDDLGQVGWKAYYVSETDTWRMIFLDDERSLKVKYEFAKTKQLAGVGIWALGFDSGRPELWSLLKEAFGTKQLADSRENYSGVN
jgi:spore germination protein YaaH